MNFSDKTENISNSGWHGTLNLVYANYNNHTQIKHNHTQAPLKLQRPFYPEGRDICHSVILHTAGGIVGGDKLDYKIQLQPQTHALITTTTAGKIYRSTGSPAKQNLEIILDSHSYLEWLPQETIVFNGAIFQQKNTIKLSVNSCLTFWEITRFGRSARGEKFTQGHWQSQTEVWQENRPLWIDRQQLIGSEENFNSPHALAGNPIVGTLAWIGKPVTPETMQKARDLWQNPLSQNQTIKGEAGVTRLSNGLLCRYRGHSTEEVRNWFIAVWNLLRLSYLKRPSCTPRVWPV